MRPRLDAFGAVDLATGVRAHEVRRVLVAQSANRFRIGVVLVVVRAGVDVHVELFGRDQNRHAAVQIDAQVSIGGGTTVGQVHVRRSQCAFGRLENVAGLAQPPDGDRLLGNGERPDFRHQAHVGYCTE